MSSWFSAFGTGLALAATLIIAIGAQNAFVLRQGLRREHVGAVVLFCALCDLLLMAAGVAGLGRALQGQPLLERALTAGGALFLLIYGLRALWRARHPGALRSAASATPASRRVVLLQAAGFTLLNPHVYLDTVLLVGAVGAQLAAAQRPVFVAGAALASVLWFSSLGYGARRLAPWFARERSWQWLELGVGLTMLLLAAALGWRLFNTPADRAEPGMGRVAVACSDRGSAPAEEADAQTPRNLPAHPAERASQARRRPSQARGCHRPRTGSG